MLSQLKIELGPIDKTVNILGIDGTPLPAGIGRTIEPENPSCNLPVRIDLALVEKGWDNFNLDLYMKILRLRAENF